MSCFNAKLLWKGSRIKFSAKSKNSSKWKTASKNYHLLWSIKRRAYNRKCIGSTSGNLQNSKTTKLACWKVSCKQKCSLLVPLKKSTFLFWTKSRKQKNKLIKLGRNQMIITRRLFFHLSFRFKKCKKSLI